jgi:hypothetical protein
MDFRDKVNFGTKLRKDENVQIIRKGMWNNDDKYIVF